jgi:G3E family GTPase
MMNLPVNVISGYLGSGKTTYINKILRGASGVKYAVLVNDFGELNIDYDLIESASERKISLVNGCVCCSIGNDIDTALSELSLMDNSIDSVLLEASGVALPDRVCDLILNWPGFELESSITLVDVTRVRHLVNDKFVGGHVRQQLIQASELQLSKTDLIPADELQEIICWLQDEYAGDEVGRNSSKSAASKFSTGMKLESEAISRSELVRWLNQLDTTVVRVKGFVFLQEDIEIRFLLQWVEGDWSLEPIGPWQTVPRTQLVLISVTI